MNFLNNGEEMRKIYKSSKGRIIDMDALRKASEKSPAVGNMNVNGRGDRLGPGGVIYENVNSRSRKLHHENPRAVREVSLKPRDQETDNIENIKKNMPDVVKKQTKRNKNTIDKNLEREDKDGNIIIDEPDNTEEDNETEEDNSTTRDNSGS